jgi:GxxExxY protein
LTESTELKQLEETEYDLAGKVIGASMRVHRTLGPGYSDAVYLNALTHELGKLQLKTTREAPVKVYYDGVEVGTHLADLLVDDAILAELETDFTKSHEAQMVNHLTSAGLETGLLLNFGTKSLEFKRKSRISRPAHSVTSV